VVFELPLAGRVARRTVVTMHLTLEGQIVLSVAVVVVVLAAAAVRREFKRRRRAELALKDANAELARRVEQKIEELGRTTGEWKLEVAKRQRAEEAERKQREIWRVTLNSIGDAVIATDIEGRVTFANQTAEVLTGWSFEEASGRPLADVFAAVDERTGQRVKDPVARVLSDGAATGRADATVLITRDGRRTPIEHGGAPIRDDRGEVLGAVLAFRDVTSRRRAETAMREHEELLRLGLTAAQMGIWDMNLVSGELVWSEQLEPIFGLEPGTFGGTFDDFIELIHPDDREYVTGRIDAAIAERREFEATFRVVRPTGEVRWILEKGQATYDLNWRATRMRGVGLDITALKHAEAERELLLAREQTARQEAENANRLKDEFLATVSHELRAPLNAILGWVKLLRQGKLDASAAGNALETIERSARAQSRLIEDLLDVSRIITGKLRLEMSTVDMGLVTRAALASVRPLAEAKGITLTEELGPAEAYVSGDPNRLQQVIWNLLSNAVKFTPKGGMVDVQLTSSDGRVEIAVRDTGQGIKPEFLPYVFERFRQADSSSVRRHGGLGLGLAIVRHLVDMHGGSVRVDSEGDGKGSVFTVSLPLVAKREEPSQRTRVPAIAGDAAPDMAPRLSGLTVLVVDDEDDARRLMVQVLQSCGATVLAAGYAAEALERVSSHQPDVIVSDIAMPEEDGYSLIRRVRALDASAGGRTPAVAVTAYARLSDRVRALSAGFQSHLAKPVEPVDLATVVANLADRAPEGLESTGAQAVKGPGVV
jgi:PAS domain S-box-containing protein